MRTCRWSIALAAAVVATLLGARASAEEYFAEAAAGAGPPPPPPADDKGPPLPFHSIEGVGGGAITPMAYLIDPPRNGHFFGKPAMAMSYVGLSSKSLTALTVTEAVGERIELGYGGDHLGLGNLPHEIEAATGADLEGRSDLWLHNFNVRTMLVKENTCFGGIALPAITAGVHFKYNSGIKEINENLGGALHDLIGYQRENGTDFTLTATKTIPPDVFGRPLIVSAGVRESQGAELGFLGFGDKYLTRFEGNVAYLLLDNLVVAYEIRQKSSPFGEIPGLVGGEDVWHAFDLGFILSKHATLVAGWGIFGNVVNEETNGAWWLQLKYEL
jgi:hypothetical protein